MNSIKKLFLEITNSCTQSCVHCSSFAEINSSDNIPFSLLCSIVEQAISLGLKEITLSGGEPLLHPDIISFLDFLQKKKIKTNIYSSGIILTGKKLDVIPDFIIEKLTFINKVIFSLHGKSSHIHEKISKIQGSFDITCKSIDKACKRKIPVELHFVPMNLNINDLDGIIQYASSKGIKNISLLRLVPQGRCSNELMLSCEQKQQLYKNVKRLRIQYPNIKIRMGAPFNCINFSGIRCSAAQNKLLISAKGEVFPCEAFKFLRGTRPTIYQSTLEEIWENDKLLNNIRKISLPQICINCTFKRFCLGGCHGQRLLANGDLIGCDPDCILNHSCAPA